MGPLRMTWVAVPALHGWGTATSGRKARGMAPLHYDTN
jgi:hypothetical protein